MGAQRRDLRVGPALASGRLAIGTGTISVEYSHRSAPSNTTLYFCSAQTTKVLFGIACQDLLLAQLHIPLTNCNFDERGAYFYLSFIGAERRYPTLNTLRPKLDGPVARIL